MANDLKDKVKDLEDRVNSLERLVRECLLCIADLERKSS